MAIYNLESRIRKLESYDKVATKEECDKMRKQIAGLKKAIEEDKLKK